MRKVNIGVAGAGIYGNYHIRIYSCDPHMETVVSYDLNEERRVATQNHYQIGGYAGVKEMITTEKLDAVSITTSDPYHYEPIKTAMGAGVKCLMTEKPLATSIEGCEGLITTAEGYSMQIAVDSHKRQDPAYNNMRDEILIDKENIIRGYISLDDMIDVPMN